MTWLRQTTSAFQTGPGSEEHRTMPSGSAYSVSAARQIWDHGAGFLALAEALIFRADAEQRLQLAASVPSVDILGGQAVQPLQRLLLDHVAEATLSHAVNRAFGRRVHVNRAGGSQLHLHLGTPSQEPRLDSAEYLTELLGLPIVAEQGDGMRSFIGLLLALTATPYPIVLIDEPEAFLHPPQARELGRLAGANSGQRVVATHSIDVLLGILDTNASTTVIRLQRVDEQNIPSVLGGDRISEIWRDPSLRYSNLLDGLFHSGVVITESDGDARLYNAALDATLATHDEPSTDLMFTHCGGKHGLPKAIEALLPLGVPVAAIADIDVLRTSQLLSEIVEALGGDWELIRRDWSVLSNAVTQRPALSPLIEDTRRQIDEVLAEEPAARLTEAQSRRIRHLTKTADGWKALKEGGGVNAFPRGEGAEAGARLVAALAEIGLFVVPVGELEGWAPNLGNHGGRFAQAALSAAVPLTDGALQAFVRQVANHLQGDLSD